MPGPKHPTHPHLDGSCWFDYPPLSNFGKEFPRKVVKDHIVMDWSSDQDPGDEDDGLVKAIERYLKENGKAS